MSITASQNTFLDKRLREHAKEQPEIRQLKRILLKLGGCHLVAPPTNPDQIVPHLLQSGFIMQGTVSIVKMERNSCHLNASKLWIERKHGVVAIGSGYALSDDGLWRQHTWGVLREGLLETTCLYDRYFGIIYWSGLADAFAECQYRMNGVACGSTLEEVGTQDAAMPQLETAP